MPRHRSLNLKKFVDAIPETMMGEYFEMKSAGRVVLDGYDAESVGSFLSSPGEEELKSSIQEDFTCINDICEKVMNHLVKAVHRHGVTIHDEEKREELAMRIFLHHPEAFEYAYDKFCIYNADNKMSHHNIAADGFQITDDKLESFKSRVGEFYFNLAKGQECIVKTYDEEDETLMLVLHGSYRRSVPAWDGPQIRTLFYRPATEDALRFKKKTGTLSIKAPYKRDKENYIKIFTEVIVEDGSQATRPDRDATYTLEPLQNGTFSFAGNEAISGVTLLEVRLSLHGGATPEVLIRSHDVLRTLQEGLGGNIRLDAGELVHAKFRFKLQIDGKTRSVTFEITPPNVTNLHRSRYADIIGAYLKENGVKLV